MTPTFPNDTLVVCIGTPKSGTSTLYELMARHPKVAVTKFKESHFFSDASLYKRGYQHHIVNDFLRKPGSRMYFDADPLYIYDQNCLERIRSSNANCRIVIMLRHPLERVFSEFLALMKYRDPWVSFEKLCNQWLRMGKTDVPDRSDLDIFNRSLYVAPIQEVLRIFGREHVYFILFDEFVADEHIQFAAFQQWLGIDVLEVGAVHENAGGTSRSKLLSKLISHPHYSELRRIISLIIPSYGMRRQLAEIVWQLNNKPFEEGRRPSLELDAVPSALIDIFRADLVMLQEMIGVDLTRWIKSLTKHEVHL